jgi:catechol 2,3-dioxygenase-like lactoylglutathione lyase family enzyme
MALDRLDHYTIRTGKLKETRDFYVEVLGLAEGFRPAFDFPGHWLYVGERAVVHLIGADPKDGKSLIRSMGDRPVDGLVGSGAVDHVAFGGTGLAAMRSRVEKRRLAYRERTVPGGVIHQMFLEDPNGIVIEINYPAAELAEAAA